MTSELARLFKILKDSTRQRIILLLHERGDIGYTDLMKELGISSTGKMNYHLKVLNGLLSKTSDNKYSLTDKGLIAAKLLVEFPEGVSRADSEMRVISQFWLTVALLAVGASVIFSILYTFGFVSFGNLLIGIIGLFLAIILAYTSYRMREVRAKWSPKSQMLGAEISYVFLGATIGVPFGFFGGGLIMVGLVDILGRVRTSLSYPTFWTFTFWILNPIFGAVIGAIVGYLVYKKSKYSKITYYNPFSS
jgi:DNA-binding transcriptional ArsR family regulator